MVSGVGPGQDGKDARNVGQKEISLGRENGGGQESWYRESTGGKDAEHQGADN